MFHKKLGSFLLGLFIAAGSVVLGQVPITGLPQATLPLSGNETTLLIQNGVTKQGPVSSILTPISFTAGTGITLTPNPLNTSGTIALTTPVTVANGGTGVSSLSGLVFGNGASAFSVYGGTSCTNQFPRSLNASGVATCNSVSLTADVTGTLPIGSGGTNITTYTLGDTLYSSATNVLSKLAGNTSTTKQFLTQTGNGATSAAPVWGTIASGDLPGSFSGFANPSGLIGLAATNGVATTATRSDATHALDQSIAPTWTGTHIFNGAATSSVATSGWSLGQATNRPNMVAVDTNGAADSKVWQWITSGGTDMIFRVQNDAASVQANILDITRSGATITSLAFGNGTNNPTYSFPSTSQATFSGNVQTPYLGVGIAPSSGITRIKTDNGGSGDNEILIQTSTSGNAQVRTTNLSGANWSFGNLRSDNSFNVCNAVTLTSCFFKLNTSGTMQGFSTTTSGLVDMSPDTGSFTITFTGMSSATTGTAVFYKIGKMVQLWIPALLGTSNAVTFTATGLPAAIQPATTPTWIVVANQAFENNGVQITTQQITARLDAGGVITFAIAGTVNTWTGANSKGTVTPVTTFYLMN